MKISIIVPCYNEESNVRAFYNEILMLPEKLPEGTELELIFVNDGSRDKTMEIIKELARSDSMVKYIDF